MASIWLWSAAPLVLVAGSRPVGQSPAKPALSSTVSDPPGLPGADELVPVALAELVAAELVAAPVFELEDFEELPHAATARQAQAASSVAPQRRPLIRARRCPARDRLRGLSP